MRSDRDKRTDSEREIDAFLSQFETPVDEMSADISTYLNDNTAESDSSSRPFHWLDDPQDLKDVAEPLLSELSFLDPEYIKSVALEEAAAAAEQEKAEDQTAEEAPADAGIADDVVAEDLTESTAEAEAETEAETEEDYYTAPESTGDQASFEQSEDYDSDELTDKYISSEAAEIHAAHEITEKHAASEPGEKHAASEPGEKHAAPEIIEEYSVPEEQPVTSADIDRMFLSSSGSPEEPAEVEEPAGFLKGFLSKQKKSRSDRSEKTENQDQLNPIDDAAPYHSEAETEIGSEYEPEPAHAAKKKAVRPDNHRLRSATLKSAAKTTAAKTAAATKSIKENIRKKKLSERLFLKPNPSFDPAQPVSRSNKPTKFSFLKLIRDLVCLGLVAVLCGAIAAGVIIHQSPHYDYKDIYSAVDTSSLIYDDKEKQVDSVFYTQNRKVTKYEDMPQDLINAFVAIEDKTFWKHHGFNWTRMIGAVLSSFTGNGRISGTSTITQQLARNVYLADIKSQRSIRRKLLEMYYAARIEHALSKEEIIEAYLNTIYLGHGCYGVDAASKTYFSKKPSKLSLIQCASLAALPQSPDNYALLKFADELDTVSDDAKIVQREPDTIVTNDVSKERRDLTLKLMLDQGLITQSDYDSNVGKSLNSFIKPTIKSGNGYNSYYHEYVVDTVINDLMKKYEMDYDSAERMVYTGGLKIYSTLDSKAQKVIATEFQDPSNFPGINAIYRTDYDGNMLNNDDEIALYSYTHDFDEDGDFVLKDDEVKIGNDGSVTIIKDKKLHIYETEVNGGTDYSLEFKSYYLVEEGLVYSIQGGYINVPSTYKSLDSDGNLIISADYFKDHEGEMRISDDQLIITKDAYSLASKTIQPQAAMVIVDVGTGQVKAMAGGRSFKGQKLLNRALNTRQPGSSIKPLTVYGAALQKSYDLHEEGKKWKIIDFGIDKQGTKGWGDYVTVHSSIEDEKCHIEGRDWPNNVTNSFSGKNTFKTAIQRSINTCAVKLQLQVGNSYSMEQLKKFGITTAIEDESLYANDMNPAALALGAMCEGVKPLEMALAYAAFPGGGKVNTPVCYTKVLDRNGDVLLESESKSTEALNEGVAWIMTDVLKSVVTANAYGMNGATSGGKTGTTNDKYDIWFDGFTPSYAASLWIGTDQNVEMTDMSYVAAHLWAKIMSQIPKACKGKYASMPSNVTRYYGEYFTEGTNTGLTSWSAEEERKKREAAARKKWEAEREKHKYKVEEKGHYETRVVTPEVSHYEWDTRTVPAEYDDEGNEISPEHEEKYNKHLVIDKPAVTKKVWVVDEKAHWEYEKGWRDGDFHYSE